MKNSYTVAEVQTALKEVQTLQEHVRQLDDVTRTRLYSIYTKSAIFENFKEVHMTERETVQMWVSQWKIDFNNVVKGRMPNKKACVVFDIRTPHDVDIAEKMYRYLRLLVVRIFKKVSKCC